MSLQTIFPNLLRTGRYGELYDTLPSAFQKQIDARRGRRKPCPTRRVPEAPVGWRSDESRSDRSSSRASLPSPATTIFGQLTRPITTSTTGEIRQGRVSSQQYLIRENGAWKIASAKRTDTLVAFMKDHPEVATLFPQTPDPL
jgi:hypothetical protein